jgi:hypothetical protein
MSVLQNAGFPVLGVERKGEEGRERSRAGFRASSCAGCGKGGKRRRSKPKTTQKAVSPLDLLAITLL